LGFDPSAYMTAPRVIKGLVAGSAAARAGLHDGDAVVSGMDVSDPSFKYDKPITLTILRGGAEMGFTFTPQGEAVTGYRWARNPHVHDAPCRL
jgi:hypothetical protein